MFIPNNLPNRTDRAVPFTMRILPVLDLLNSQVVRGVAGRRREYRPVVSRLCKSSKPLDVARAFRDHFRLTEVYLADLDAIGGSEPAYTLYADLREVGFHLWVDAGVVEAERGRTLAAYTAGVVIGLETVAGPAVLADLCRELGERIVFSLDLRGGVPLGKTETWRNQSAWEIATQAVSLGARRVLVLDLARVGVGEGTGTQELCERLATAHPEAEVWAGGGIRGVEDLRPLRECGVRAALVASALHDGTLSRADLDSL
jgi:phosphoribosylformimino-5-aminoimidazole carboxamide ribotide isomerase